ncbi:MAG TPA: nicotinate-nucleotide adenylyltransferase [Candidatus Acidoferrales bacterium]|nr:nicotinate-nucleotide adenylyltransferase [Candidatus Acidoferrales bacterium]
MNPERLGIFGGTFDPIHVGHLFVANAMLWQAQLDRVLFMPVGEPAHRRTHASPEARATMVRMSIEDNPRFALDDTALRQAGPVYTVDTMPLLRAAYPKALLSFIAGIDSLVASPWRRLDEVARSLERFFVVAREGASPADLQTILTALPQELAVRFAFVKLPLVDVSSTAIRSRVANGEPVRYLVPDSVAAYVHERGLYTTRA